MDLKIGVLSLLLLLTATNHVIPQENGNQKATLLVSQYFDNLFGADERLITGPFYYGPTRGSIQGHPYYIDDFWKDGTIETADDVFRGLKLKYDNYLNRIILMYTSTDNAVYQVGLRPGNIVRATIGGNEFIPLPVFADSINTPFAEVISDGEVQYLVTRLKTLQITSGSGSSDYVYKENFRQYLCHNGTLIPFKGKNSLFRLFPELKEDLKRFIRMTNIYPTRKNTQDRAKLIDYCNTLLAGNDK
ncbi:MAG: hypothetical protein LC649_01140 [Bacteroidales bacterium]|nr:hypothetical protein [Bacteroidales bacterium]